MKESWVAVAVTVVLVGLGPPVGAAEPPGQWSAPVGGPVVRGFEPPKRPFGARHLGLDYAVPPGMGVRAAGDGVVIEWQGIRQRLGWLLIGAGVATLAIWMRLREATRVER